MEQMQNIMLNMLQSMNSAKSESHPSVKTESAEESGFRKLMEERCAPEEQKETSVESTEAESMEKTETGTEEELDQNSLQDLAAMQMFYMGTAQVIVNPEETDVCGCGGHGHLEQYASATGIVRMAKKELAANSVETSLRKYENLSAKNVFDEAKAGDAVAAALVDKLCSILAGALTHVAATVDPQVFVIGGGVSKAGEILTEGLKKHYNQNLLSALCNKDFCLATLGNDAGIFGSAKMILDKVAGK
jgi:hypothetical protein